MRIILFIITFFLSITTIEAAPPSAQQAMQIIADVPEGKQLLQEVWKNGAVRVEIVRLENEQFEAYWDAGKRLIQVNAVHTRDLAATIRAIVFELHNAKNNARFIDLMTLAYQGRISVDQYVEGMERIEHQNAIETALILDRGIAQGVFPKETAWLVLRDFEDHYAHQQLGGHSQWFVKQYPGPRSMANYKGTVKTLAQMSADDRNDLGRYLYIKNDIESPIAEERLRGQASLRKAYEHIEDCLAGTSTSNCSRTQQRIALMQQTFGLVPPISGAMNEARTAAKESFRRNEVPVS